MRLIILLEDVPETAESRRQLLKRLLHKNTISCDIKITKNTDELDHLAHTLQAAESRGKYDQIVLVSDVSLGYGGGGQFEDATEYLSNVWNAPATEWWGKVYIIVFTYSVMDGVQLSRLKLRANRVIVDPHAVAGKNLLEELKKAVLHGFKLMGADQRMSQNNADK